MSLRTSAIVEALGGTLRGDPERLITRLAPLETAGESELSFLVNPRLTAVLGDTRAGCVVVGPALADAATLRGDCIVADDPHLYFARLTQLWARSHGLAQVPGVHPSAVVEDGAVIGPGASVGPLCHVGRHARIGAGTVLKARVTVGERCVIGER
ncbi:MAG: UDP-3-O-(3-hydroxymyristoyl)glucosamine N-acyltransferase, partial [Ottowia sp.]|nr:UDP-3-O-(3-hydroxymyristoyl)glucosamine N-acyltransferase [Ottowia sp.]